MLDSVLSIQRKRKGDSLKDFIRAYEKNDKKFVCTKEGSANSEFQPKSRHSLTRAGTERYEIF
jgi:hypothetical protein